MKAALLLLLAAALVAGAAAQDSAACDAARDQCELACARDQLSVVKFICRESPFGVLQSCGCAAPQVRGCVRARAWQCARLENSAPRCFAWARARAACVCCAHKQPAPLRRAYAARSPTSRFGGRCWALAYGRLRSCDRMGPSTIHQGKPCGSLKADAPPPHSGPSLAAGVLV
jgi:hypothetical protein